MALYHTADEGGYKRHACENAGQTEAENDVDPGCGSLASAEDSCPGAARRGIAGILQDDELLLFIAVILLLIVLIGQR